MSFTVYALRIRGDKEVRYVGQTGLPPAARLYTHLAQAKNHRRCLHLYPLWAWIDANRDQVEIVPLETVETRDEAYQRERVTVTTFCALGHGLFNRHLVPAELRVAA